MRIRKTLALAIAGGLFLLAPLFPAGDRAPGETKVSVDPSPLRRHSLPFSVGQVLGYFNEAFSKRPFEIEAKSFVYIDRENPDEVVIVTVSDLQASLSVVLFATGNYGVNYIREFFEAPLFSRQETEQLYRLLDEGSGIRSLGLERFDVQMSISTTEAWIVVAVEFHPSQFYRPQLALVTSCRAGSIDQCQFPERKGSNRKG